MLNVIIMIWQWLLLLLKKKEKEKKPHLKAATMASAAINNKKHVLHFNVGL